MKITFVHLGREHLGIEYLSAIAKRMGHETALAYDPGLFGLNDNAFYIPTLERFFDGRKRILDELTSKPPDLVAVSAFTGTYAWCLEIAREVKARTGVPIAFGGIHTTLVPDEVARHPFIDYVFVGEAEISLPALLESIDAGDERTDIPGIWFRRDDRVIRNGPAELVTDLSTLPFPDKSLFERMVNIEDDYTLQTSRGCPIGCSYCCEHHLKDLYKGRYHRRRDVESSMAELRHMKERYRYREVMFYDPIFFSDKGWLEEMIERYRQEIAVPYRCFGQIRWMDEDVARLLKESGCYCVEFGLQSWSEGLRGEVLHRPESNEEVRGALAICERVGLAYDIDHMFGLPTDTEENLWEAAAFYSGLTGLNRLKPHYLTYYPSLPIIDYARAEGLLTDEEVRRIEQGEMEADFFHADTVKDEKIRDASLAVSRLLKFLPLLPAPLARRIVEKRSHAWIRSLPGGLITALQVALAVRNRDYRYYLYVKYYARRISRLLLPAKGSRIKSRVK